MYFIGDQPGGSADGIIGRKFQAWQVRILVTLAFVDDYRGR